LYLQPLLRNKQAQKATEFDEIMQTARLLRHSRSPILVPIESPYATSF